MTLTKEIKPSTPEKTVKNTKSGSMIGLIIGLIILILSLGGMVFLILTLPSKAKQVSKLRSQSLTSSMSSQDMALLKQMIDISQIDRETLQDSFPDEASLLNFISLIDSLKNDQVTVAQFSVDSDIPTKIGRNPSFLPMTLVLRGKPKAVEQALLNLAKSKYFIRPVIISYSSDQTGENIEIKTSFQLFVSETYAKTKS